MPAPAQLKQILDRDFPVQGYRFDDMVRGKEALGGSPTDEKTATEFMVSPLIHAAKWREGNAVALCCEQRSSGWRQFDRLQYLDLMEALAAGELAGHLQFRTQVQGKPEAALHEADLYDQVHFHGLDPQIMAARIHAIDSVEASAAGSGNTRALHAQKVELAKKILSWQSAQTQATADAVFLDAQHGLRDAAQPRGVRIQVQDADASLFDFPRRPVWSNRVSPAIRDDSLRLAVQRTACRDVVGHVWMCTAYLERLREKMGQQMYRNEIAQLLEPRFAGSAARATFLADVKVEGGDVAGAQALLKESIANEPGQMGL